MSVLLVVLPLSLLVSAMAILAFVAAVGRGEFDDLETPARRMLLEDSTPGRTASDNDRALGDSAGLGDHVVLEHSAGLGERMPGRTLVQHVSADAHSRRGSSS